MIINWLKKYILFVSTEDDIAKKLLLFLNEIVIIFNLLIN